MIAIAAMSRNRVIGKDGALPWHLPGDLQFFKRTTSGHAIVMGRKTYESIGRPLPGRQNIVLTRKGGGWNPPPGVTVVHDPNEIHSKVEIGRKIFLIGGGSLYRELLPRCESLFLTWIDRDVDGDTFFPDFEELFPNYTLVETGPGFEIRHYSSSN